MATKRTNIGCAPALGDNDREELPLKKRIKLLADTESSKTKKNCEKDTRSKIGSFSAPDQMIGADSLLKLLPSALLSFARSNGVNTVSDDEDDSAAAAAAATTTAKPANFQAFEQMALPSSQDALSAPCPPPQSQHQPLSRIALRAPRQLFPAQAKSAPQTVVTHRNFCLNGKPMSSRPALPTAQNQHLKKLQEIQTTLS